MGEWIVNGVDISPEAAAESYAAEHYWSPYPSGSPEDIKAQIKEAMCRIMGIGCSSAESQ